MTHHIRTLDTVELLALADFSPNPLTKQAVGRLETPEEIIVVETGRLDPERVDRVMEELARLSIFGAV
ncbi:MAG: hypothetical protein WC498_02720 [Candidatus Saccharimonadales bacterium]